MLTILTTRPRHRQNKFLEELVDLRVAGRSVAVFLGFAFDPSVVIKMIGVDMSAAIAIDATLIRLIVVPATMALLGRSSRYLPSWLDRLLPTLDSHSRQDPAETPKELQPVA